MVSQYVQNTKDCADGLGEATFSAHYYVNYTWCLGAVGGLWIDPQAQTQCSRELISMSVYAPTVGGITLNRLIAPIIATYWLIGSCHLAFPAQVPLTFSLTWGPSDC